jgi:ATP-dependent RNA helicase RhlE
MTFKDLKLDESILKAIEKSGYTKPTPIQEQAIPHILEGKDVLACARTGTGKTAAFALPLIQKLIKSANNQYDKKIKILVLKPTRELAIQIRDNFRAYSINMNLKVSVILGGVNQRSQVEVLRKGLDILVATPGRLLDLINQKHVNLNSLQVLVLDEADTMLDMGFIKDVKKIISYIPTKYQTLLFSATMPDEINKLAESLLKKHVTIKVDPISSTPNKINQLIYFVDKNNKSFLLLNLLKKEAMDSVLIFSRTKHGANKLSEILSKNKIYTEVIHGNKSQNARVAALKNFKNGKSKILIATDIAAHGIDINGLSHVINYDLPEVAENYVHRIGRTGRAGLEGTAISFCDINEKKYLKEIQKLIKQEIYVVENHDYPLTNFTLTPAKRNFRYKNNKRK